MTKLHNKQKANKGADKWELEIRNSDAPAVTREQQIAVLSEYGSEIVKSMITVSDKYYQVCLYIRTHAVEADVVRDALDPLGFRKQRITEIYRVATASDALWSEFAARALSFRRTLELSRGTVQLLLNEEQQRTSAWVNDIPDDEAKRKEAVEEEERKHELTPFDRLEPLVNRIAVIAEKGAIRGKTFICENGWSVKVFKTVAKKGQKQ